MASVERQQHALEVLKSINKAITNLRLYPEQSVQVVNAVETAYAELKIFSGLYGVLCFGLHKGVATLDGTLYEKKEREQLDELALVDFLDKAGLEVMTLTQGIDRQSFKQVVSFFVTNPEQIQKSGGSAAFVKNAGLSAVFMEAGGDKLTEEHAHVQSFADFLQERVAAGVRQADILTFLKPREGGHQSKDRGRLFQDLDKGVNILAAALCSLLQPLQRAGVYGASPPFSQLLDALSAVLKDGKIRKVAAGTASLLTANLDRKSLALLFCQNFATPFGELLFSSLIAVIDKEIFRSLVDFLREEGERLAGSLHEGAADSSFRVNETCQRLMETAKGRQLHAIECMGVTEKQRQVKRLQAGLSALAQGSLEGLRNKEILLHLPATFERLLINKKENVAAAIIQTLVGGLKLDDEALRLRAGEGLGLIGEKLVSREYWGWLEKITPTFLFLVMRAEDDDASCKSFIVILQEMLTHAQKRGNEKLAEKILSLFYAIRSGALGKTPEMRNLVGQAQDKGVDRNVLQAYLDQYFAKPITEMYCQKIVMHGPLGIQFLLDSLLANSRRPERIRLLKILASVGGQLSPLLLARLPEPMPWYGKRNLIRLLGATGEEKDVSAVQEFLGHEDLRVQSEALSCIYKLSAQKKKEYLLEALPMISEKLKFQVVQDLAAVVDEEVVAVLVELLQDEKYFSADIKTTLLVSICDTMGRSGSPQAQKGLQQLAGSGNVRPRNMAKEVWQAAQRGLALLETSHRQRRQRTAEIQKISKSAVRLAQSGQERLVKGYAPVTNLAEEQEIYALLAQNKKAAAKGLLLDLISMVSYLRQFDQAEVLCQRLIEIDPLALEDIVKATELVEEQKIASVDQGQTMNWVELYDFLTTEEFNALYAARKHVTYGPDEDIVVQGDLQQQLFFINKGRVKLFHRDPHGNDILLKTVGPGDLFGGDSFFKASVWTVNAASFGTVDAFVLPGEALRIWQATFPELESKLSDFCQRLGEHVSPEVMAIDRRGTERLNFTGRLAMALLDDQGKAIGTVLLGEKGDVSSGGISFTVRISHKRNIRLLLGRKVLASLPDGPPDSQLTSGMTGLVVAIYGQDATGKESAGCVHYSVHVQFDHPLPETELAAVVSSN